jgi:hypothetical protein
VNLWILGKFARRLHENLRLQGVLADIAMTPDTSADINHHIIYSYYDGRKTTIDTVMITHIDAEWKLDLVRQQLVNAEMGICMSDDTHRKLVRHGIPRHKLCYVNPAHDGAVRPRKRLIGITSKVQPTGCKREDMLLDLAGQISGDDFTFFIMGAGWSAIVDSMRKLGIEVDYHDDFDEAIYRARLSSLDYYLYLGQDEGSMGFVDALCAGIPTIVTPQGFHLDAINGITHSFNNLQELVNIFHEIADRKNRLSQAVEAWTWPEYARKHIAIWDYLLREKSSAPILNDQRAELKSMRLAQSKALSNLSAGFYHGVRLLRNRERMGEMVRYRLGRYWTSARKHG